MLFRSHVFSSEIFNIPHVSVCIYVHFHRVSACFQVKLQFACNFKISRVSACFQVKLVNMHFIISHVSILFGSGLRQELLTPKQTKNSRDSDHALFHQICR